MLDSPGSGIIQYLMVWTLDNRALLYRTQADATGILNYFEKWKYSGIGNLGIKNTRWEIMDQTSAFS